MRIRWVRQASFTLSSACSALGLPAAACGCCLPGRRSPRSPSLCGPSSSLWWPCCRPRLAACRASPLLGAAGALLVCCAVGRALCRGPRCAAAAAARRLVCYPSPLRSPVCYEWVPHVFALALSPGCRRRHCRLPPALLGCCLLCCLLRCHLFDQRFAVRRRRHSVSLVGLGSSAPRLLGSSAAALGSPSSSLVREFAALLFVLVALLPARCALCSWPAVCALCSWRCAARPALPLGLLGCCAVHAVHAVGRGAACPACAACWALLGRLPALSSVHGSRPALPPATGSRPTQAARPLTCGEAFNRVKD